MTGDRASGRDASGGVGERRWVPLLLVTHLLGAVAPHAGCDRRDPVDARVALLRAERRALETYLRAEPSEPIVPKGDVLVVVRARLLGELLRSILPVEAPVGEYRVRLDSAEVDLRPGLARVRLIARARPAAPAPVFADVALLGAFEIEPFPEAGQPLHGRVRVFGVETRDVGVTGLSPPAEPIVDALARLRTRAFSDVLGRVQIPVQLLEVLEVPALDAAQATIPAAKLPVRFELAGVRVLEEGIFISLRVDREWTDVARWTAGGVEESGR